MDRSTNATGNEQGGGVMVAVKIACNQENSQLM